MILIQVISFLLIVKGGSLALDSYYYKPPAKALIGLKLSIKKKRFLDRFMEGFLQPMTKAAAPFIRLSEEREAKLKYALSRAGIKETPKEYYAKAIILAVLSLLLPAVLIVLGVKSLSLAGLILSGMILYQQLTSYKTELKKKRNEIEMGLPGFIRSILYKLNDKKSGVIKADLISIFEDYLKVANPVFAWDISVLIMEMKAKDIEVAVRSFNNRLAIPEVGFLCNALIGLTRGEYQSETLASLAREMDIKSKENIKRELEKRPSKVLIACIPLFAISFLAIGYVMLQAMTGGLATLSQ
ncbi:hypothetical protein [Aminipila butyrica]|nr:hypothetical protein [Aminipila butyrica]